MSWLLIGVITWGALAPGVALVIGLAFRRANGDVPPAAWTDEVDSFLRDHDHQTPETSGSNLGNSVV